MSELKTEITYVKAQQAAIVNTMSTAGWPLVKQVADKIVNKAVQEALDAEDATGEPKRLKAAALRKGFNELFSALESIRDFKIDPGDSDGLGALEMQDAVQQ